MVADIRSSWTSPQQIMSRLKVHPSREQLVRVGLTVAILAVVLVAAFGVGYRSSGVVLDNAGAFLPKGDTVVYVNAETGSAEAEAAVELAPKRQKLEVVNVAPGVAYVVNNETNEVWRLPGDTMRPQPVDRPPTGASPPGTGTGTPGPSGPSTGREPSSGNTPNSVHPVAGGGKTYLIDTDHGTLNLVDGTKVKPVQLEAPIDQAIVDNTGTAWALSVKQGTLYEIVGTDVRQSITASMPGEAAHLTLVDNRPVVLLPDHSGQGVVRMFGPDNAHPELTVSRHPGRAVSIAKPGADQRFLVTVVQTTDTVTAVDLSTGAESSIQMTERGDATMTRSYGGPVVLRNRVYVPDYTNRQVVVLELSPLKQVGTVPVPGKEQFDVFALDGRVWVNDQYHRKGIAIDGGDNVSDIDKGPGHGVDGTPPTATPTPSPNPTKTKPPQPNPTTKPRKVQVPNVMGMDEAAACAAMTKANLPCRQPAATGQRPGCEIGKVIETIPAQGSLVSPGTRITIVLCGPTAVPDVNGMLIDQATKTISATGLRPTWAVGGTAQRPEDRGKVIGQNPAVGAQVSPGSAVDLRYLDPLKVLVPDVAGLGPQQACDTVWALGFGCAYNANLPTWQTNVVLGQDPPPGTPADAYPPARTPVRLYYQTVAPVRLYRYKRDGEDVRFLSLSNGPKTGWSLQPPIGGVYGQRATVAGLPLVNVYQFSCQPTCIQGRTVGYYYDTKTTPPASHWRIDNGGQPVFSCIDENYAAPGTVRLVAMHSGSLQAWAFAPEGSGEYTYHQQNGNYQPEFTICRLWYGVGGFP